MREHEFRYYDKFNDDMVYSDGFLTLSVFFACKEMADEGENGTVLLESTGLLDKNGVKIFKGDIIATSNKDPEYDVWSKKDFGYAVVEITPDAGAMFIGSSILWPWCEDDNDTVYNLKFCEVIGNLYMNPDLLDGDNTGGE